METRLLAIFVERPSIRDTLVEGRQLFFEVSQRGRQVFLYGFSDQLQLRGYGQDLDGRFDEATRSIALAFATRTARQRAGGKLALRAGARARIAVAGNAFRTSANAQSTTAGRARRASARARITSTGGAPGAVARATRLVTGLGHRVWWGKEPRRGQDRRDPHQH
jgi:hypothetical protein